jgi:hypothetical protein
MGVDCRYLKDESHVAAGCWLAVDESPDAGEEGLHSVQRQPSIYTASPINKEKNWSTTLGPNSQRHSISDRTVNTGALFIAQIHGYLLGFKSIKTLIVGLQKI